MSLREKDFDLSQFLPGSLSLNSNVSPACAPAFELVKQEDPYIHLYTDDPLKTLGETGDWKPLSIEENFVGTPTQEFYRGKNIFITGGTGFVGKVLFQKLLRSIPHIGVIYLLIRAKKGSIPQERFSKLLEDKLFLRMKAEVPGYLDKIRVLEGDLAEEGLGLSSADRQLLIDNVHVVFHSAADVRFLEPLKSAVTSNVIGSRRVLQLAKKFKKLKVYVHVSTAYSHCVRRVIEEKCYTMNVHYKDIIKYMESKTDQEIEQETERLMQGWPNAYTFSKGLAENMVEEEADGMPVCIYRPTVVWPTVSDPLRGWTDNIYGPNGMMMGGAMGVIHVYRIPEDSWLDCVPVDFVVNSLIVVAMDTASTFEKCLEPVKVYNYSATPQKPLSWKTIVRFCASRPYLFPLVDSIWHVSIHFTESKIIEEIGHIVLHKIPGKLIDFIAVLTGQKPRLSKIYDKVYFITRKLEPFGFGHWEFENDKIYKLWTDLEKSDRELFPFDHMALDMEEYALIGKLGLRYFIQKASMESLPYSIKKQKWLEWAHYTFLTVSGLIALKIAAVIAHLLPI